jgi:hypothetical protein
MNSPGSTIYRASRCTIIGLIVHLAVYSTSCAHIESLNRYNYRVIVSLIGHAASYAIPKSAMQFAPPILEWEVSDDPKSKSIFWHNRPVWMDACRAACHWFHDYHQIFKQT